MKDYRMNLATNTLTVSKAFADKALNPNSTESQIIEHCRALCPNLKITYKTHKVSSSRSKPYDGLNYTKMENYIKLYANADELLTMFGLVKEIAKIQKSKIQFVYNWFIQQFPNYHEIPEIKNGKLYRKVFEIPEVEKAQEVVEMPVDERLAG